MNQTQNPMQEAQLRALQRNYLKVEDNERMLNLLLDFYTTLSQDRDIDRFEDKVEKTLVVRHRVAQTAINKNVKMAAEQDLNEVLYPLYETMSAKNPLRSALAFLEYTCNHQLNSLSQIANAEDLGLTTSIRKDGEAVPVKITSTGVKERAGIASQHYSTLFDNTYFMLHDESQA